MLAIVPVVLGGCEANTCEYGSEGSNASDCTGRPAPTEAEANGWREDSVRARIDEFESAQGADAKLVGITITNWGEIAFVEAAGGTEEIHAYDVEGEPIDLSDELPTTGDVPFAVSDVRADALEEVMTESERLHPGFPFTNAELIYQAPRNEVGRDFSRRILSWTVTVGEGSDYVYYETDAEGRIMCERVGGSAECTAPAPS